jgi:hypothetical protein
MPNPSAAIAIFFMHDSKGRSLHRARHSRATDGNTLRSFSEPKTPQEEACRSLSRAALSTDQEDERGEVTEHACAGLLSARVGTRWAIRREAGGRSAPQVGRRNRLW